MVSAPPFNRSIAREARGFTLIEAVLALGISAVVLAAIGGVFYSALRLRDRTFAALNDGSSLQPALNYLKRDLKGAMPPDGYLASIFRCGQLGGFLGQGFGLDFVTTTGGLNEELPGGDLQEVIYMLREPTNTRRGSGMDLVRMANRNLLATIPELPPEQVLLSGVQEFEVECYDGYTWRNYWDTTLTDTNLPVAVRVQLLVAPQESIENGTVSRDGRAAMEFVVPLMTQSRTNTAGSSTEETTTQ
jgi:type II secretory pathway component PulJ